MAEAAPRRMTIDEFLAWTGEPDVHYQLRDGIAVAMAPPADAHGILAANVIIAIGNGLRNKPGCRVRTQAGIASPSNPRSLHEADIVVACTPSEPKRRLLPDPVLVIEVLSPSTAEDDFQVKLPDYRLIPSVREIVLIDSRRKLCQVHRRGESDEWPVQILGGDEAVLRLESIGFEAALGALYEGVPIEAARGA